MTRSIHDMKAVRVDVKSTTGVWKEVSGCVWEPSTRGLGVIHATAGAIQMNDHLVVTLNVNNGPVLQGIVTEIKSNKDTTSALLSIIK